LILGVVLASTLISSCGDDSSTQESDSTCVSVDDVRAGTEPKSIEGGFFSLEIQAGPFTVGNFAYGPDTATEYEGKRFLRTYWYTEPAGADPTETLTISVSETFGGPALTEPFSKALTARTPDGESFWPTQVEVPHRAGEYFLTGRTSQGMGCLRFEIEGASS
jgi:hypothetical protein